MPLPDLAQTAPALGRRAKVDVAGVLDGDHMSTRHSRSRLLAPAGDQALDRHILVGEKPTEAHLPRPIVRAEPTQASALTRDHAFEQRRPLLSSRRSRNSPNDRLSFDIATPRINEVSLKESQTRLGPPDQKSKLSQSAAAPRCVHAVVRRGEGNHAKRGGGGKRRREKRGARRR